MSLQGKKLPGMDVVVTIALRHKLASYMGGTVRSLVWLVRERKSDEQDADHVGS